MFTSAHIIASSVNCFKQILLRAVFYTIIGGLGTVLKWKKGHGL
jgi:hypothetical protein